jgi:hypothetical protein
MRAECSSPMKGALGHITGWYRRNARKATASERRCALVPSMQAGGSKHGTFLNARMRERSGMSLLATAYASKR